MATPDEGLEIDHEIDVGDGQGQRLTASYWRVMGYDAKRSTNRVRLTVQGWRSYDDFAAGLPPVERSFAFTVGDPKFIKYFGQEQISKKGRNVIVQSYVYLKAETDEFADATSLPKDTSS